MEKPPLQRTSIETKQTKQTMDRFEAFTSFFNVLRNYIIENFATYMNPVHMNALQIMDPWTFEHLIGKFKAEEKINDEQDLEAHHQKLFDRMVKPHLPADLMISNGQKAHLLKICKALVKYSA